MLDIRREGETIDESHVADGKQLASAANDKVIRIWDWRTARPSDPPRADGARRGGLSSRLAGSWRCVMGRETTKLEMTSGEKVGLKTTSVFARGESWRQAADLAQPRNHHHSFIICGSGTALLSGVPGSQTTDGFAAAPMMVAMCRFQTLFGRTNLERSSGFHDSALLQPRERASRRSLRLVLRRK